MVKKLKIQLNPGNVQRKRLSVFDNQSVVLVTRRIVIKTLCKM